MNNRRNTLLLSPLTVPVFTGNAIGGKAGMVFALCSAAGMHFFSCRFSNKIVLKMYAVEGSYA